LRNINPFYAPILKVKTEKETKGFDHRLHRNILRGTAISFWQIFYNYALAMHGTLMSSQMSNDTTSLSRSSDSLMQQRSCNLSITLQWLLRGCLHVRFTIRIPMVVMFIVLHDQNTIQVGNKRDRIEVKSSLESITFRGFKNLPQLRMCHQEHGNKSNKN
jgi:hypothetical protein